MAKDNGGNWWDNQWENLPEEWGRNETHLFEEFVTGADEAAMANDRLLQALYDEALFNFDLSHEDRAAIMETMKDYVWDEYGVDFDDVFDWEGYRDAYDSVSG